MSSCHDERDSVAMDHTASMECDSDAADWAVLRRAIMVMDGDPAARAAALALVRCHAPHLLRPHGSLTAPDASPDAPSAADLIRVARTRDHALVAGTIALALSFLPARERLRAGGVSRVWHSGVQQASAWGGTGVRFGPLVCADCGFSREHGQCDPTVSAPPGWLTRSVGRLSSDASAVRYPTPLGRLRCYSGLRHLRLLPFGAEFVHRHLGHWNVPPPTVTAAAVHSALRPMRLQSLALVEMDPASERPLWQALFGLTASGAAGPSSSSLSASSASASVPAAAPLMAHWSATLVHFALGWIPLSQSATDPLLDSLAQLRLTSLRSLALQLHDRKVPPWEPCATAALRRWLNHGCLPQLQSLRLRLDARQQQLTRVELTGALLAALPQIATLTELDVDFKLGLLEKQPDGWLPGLHLLPALRVLRCDVDMELESGAAFAASIAMAPRLEVLQLGSCRAVRLVCERLRMRCEAASGSGIGVGVGGGSDGGTAVALRELHVIDEHPDVGAAGASLSDLAALPHLERLRLDTVVLGDLALVESLRQLRSLRLRMEDVHALAGLRLPHLHTLAVVGDSYYNPMSVERDLRPLLRLPSLTRLQLPSRSLSEDSMAYLRLLIRDRADRPALQLQLIDPVDSSAHWDPLWADSFAAPAPAASE